MSAAGWPAAPTEMGVEIYPGFAAAEVLYDDAGAVIGVATGDMGVERDGSKGPNYAPGMALLGKYTLIGEGVRGSLAKQLIAKFDLDRDSEPQKFGIGLKELWQVKPEHHKPGLVQHSFGWPLDKQTGGGSFLYHLEDNQVAVGFVVHLNYKNPYLSPFEEFQRFKTHPAIRETFEGGKRISYGARAITEGRLPVGAQARLPRRRADRLLGRLRQPAAHQGLSQRGAVGHDGGRKRRRGVGRRPHRRCAYRL